MASKTNVQRGAAGGTSAQKSPDLARAHQKETLSGSSQNNRLGTSGELRPLPPPFCIQTVSLRL